MDGIQDDTDFAWNLMKAENSLRDAFGQKWLNAYDAASKAVESANGGSITTYSRFILLAWIGFLANAEHAGGRPTEGLTTDMTKAIMSYTLAAEKDFFPSEKPKN